MFIDEADIYVKAGDGGNGCKSFYRTKSMLRARRDGGDGGKGGDIIIRAQQNMEALLNFRFKHYFCAQNGGHGSANRKRGKDGADCIIEVPLGTVVREFKEGYLLRDLTSPLETVLVARGGEGGKGNAKSDSSTEGKKGETKRLALELKLMVDVGIVGFPNTGKSTLLKRITKSHPIVASFPFTTKSPMLGLLEDDDYRLIVAEIPALVKGASKGKGLGNRFLRHTERAKVLLHLVDMSGQDRTPVEEYHLLNEELRQYNEDLTLKPQIVVANKMDLSSSKENLRIFCSQVNVEVLKVSALTEEGIDRLLSQIWEKTKINITD